MHDGMLIKLFFLEVVFFHKHDFSNIFSENGEKLGFLTSKLIQERRLKGGVRPEVSKFFFFFFEFLIFGARNLNFWPQLLHDFF